MALETQNHLSVVEVLQTSRRVLWIGAHPDDETSSAGLLARAADIADSLFLISVTRGENSDRLWNGLRRGSEIGAARAMLFAQSGRVLHAQIVETGPFVNGPRTLRELDEEPSGAPFQPWPPETTPEQVAAKWEGDWSGGDPVNYFVNVLRRWRPDVVISMDGYCGVSGHPEHLAVARLLLRAIPLAANPTVNPTTGSPWKVKYVIFTAHVIPELIACGYCKCQDAPPHEKVEKVPALDSSAVHGMSYFRVGCLVAKHYQNIMEEQGWSEAQIQSLCRQAEQAAREAYHQGNDAYPITEPYRVQAVNR